VTLDALSDATEGERDAWLQPVDALLSTFPLVQLNEDATRRFLHGQRLKLSELTITDEAVNAPRVRVYAPEGRLLGVAKQGEGVLAPERLVVTTAS
jgi:tRNA pseudouridine55 synthase